MISCWYALVTLFLYVCEVLYKKYSIIYKGSAHFWKRKRLFNLIRRRQEVIKGRQFIAEKVKIKGRIFEEVKVN